MESKRDTSTQRHYYGLSATVYINLGRANSRPVATVTGRLECFEFIKYRIALSTSVAYGTGFIICFPRRQMSACLPPSYTGSSGLRTEVTSNGWLTPVTLSYYSSTITTTTSLSDCTHFPVLPKAYVEWEKLQRSLECRRRGLIANRLI